jgi:hypothetical protein
MNGMIVLYTGKTTQKLAIMIGIEKNTRNGIQNSNGIPPPIS